MISPAAAPPIKRQMILPLLFCFSFLSYLLRMNISVAQHLMVPQLGLSDVQIGAVFSAFMLGYSLFQLPAGICGDRFGPRPVLAFAAVGWVLLTFLTGIIPGKVVKGAFAAFVSLLIVRFVLGAAEAATYPVAARAIANWIPQRRHAFSNAIVIVGATLGSAVTGPLIAYVMQALGWRATFYVSALLPGVLAIIWFWQIPGKTTEDQLASSEGYVRAPHAVSWWSQLRTGSTLFLCMSYFLYSYVMFIFVFWLFKYLTDVRGLTVIGSGWAASLPFLAASFALPLLGYLGDKLSAAKGILRGRRTVAMACLICAGALLFVGTATMKVPVALTAISLSVAFLFSTEGCYWSTAISLGGRHAGAAGGLMNMAGNLGGVVSTIAVPLLVGRIGWYGMFSLASAFSILGAALWLLISSSAISDAGPVVQLAAISGAEQPLDIYRNV